MNNSLYIENNDDDNKKIKVLKSKLLNNKINNLIKEFNFQQLECLLHGNYVIDYKLNQIVIDHCDNESNYNINGNYDINKK
eukprot:jgi/Orpsp1_1/1192951/evm.model.d7180000097119.1